MLFNSLTFALFFFVVYALYLATMRRLRVQNLMLLAASYLFYGWWDWRFLGLLFASTALDYWFALGIERAATQAAKRRLVAFSVVTNLGVLGFFKYFNFFSTGAAQALQLVGLKVDAVTLQIVLPVGISFYVFQSMSYVINVYRGDLQVCGRFTDFALYVSFFPQLVAGPIERATNLLPQLTKPRTLKPDQIHAGIFLILAGLFKKVVIADNVATIADQVFNNYQDQCGVNLLLGVLAFTFQIYCDFSGYSDIARGVAKTMGFDFMLNFNLPYFALSPSDFWRRWHISLSTWLRDYLYIPLGGNRGSSFLTGRNLFLTMLLGGLWHGAAWHFIVWGAFHGVLLILYRAVAPEVGRDPWRSASQAAKSVGQWGLMFTLTLVGWVLFRAQSMQQVGWILAHVGPQTDAATEGMARKLIFLVGPLVAAQALAYWRGNLLIVLKWPLPVRVAVASATVAALMILGVGGAKDFIYFQF